ncbi:MAG: hypothetical protein JNK23_20630 [Opitutaceae bacterium]|nr:hypothetical protein [Opitutaceae bacterium]
MSPHPPPLPVGASVSAHPGLTATLSIAWITFLICGAVSFFGEIFHLVFGREELAIVAGLGVLAMLLTGLVLFGLMALIPRIPKRFFLPISLYLPVTATAILPLFVYFIEHASLILSGLFLGQVVLGLLCLHRWHEGLRVNWPLFPARRLVEKNFSWSNLVGVGALGLFLILPALALYSAFSAKLTVEHLSAGFVGLRPSGISMQVRSYLRSDGKKIMLMPMSHVADAAFYEALGAAMPESSVVLMEGVTDTAQAAKRPGVTNPRRSSSSHSGYSRAASLIGGVEQRDFFKPRGTIVAADLDMRDFSPPTLGVLKSVTLINEKGLTRETLPLVLKPMPPSWDKHLLDDLITKRNRHLLGVIGQHLPTSDMIVVPWGAAHMPEIHREILKLGFQVVETKDYTAIRFRF